MKTRIIYFFQTGNSLKIGQEIAKGIEDRGNSCELVDLTKTDPATQKEWDLLGIGCPVYYYKEPFNVSEFMDKLPPGEGRYAFVYITHGSVPGTTLESMWSRLAARGYLVLGAHNKS